MKGWRREARRLVRAARLLAHFTTGLLTAHLILPFLKITGFDQQRCEAIIRAWMRRLLRILNVNLRVHGIIHTGAVLYCANHVSWLDIPCLRAVVDATFVAKSEIRDWPLVGDLAARVDTLFLNRGNRDATNRIADRMTWLLAAKQSVAVFPEGTSTDGSAVLCFHARLYQAAIRVQGRVQAVGVRYPGTTGLNTLVPFVGENNLTNHLWHLLGEESIEAELHFCEAFWAHNWQRRALANATREQVLEALASGFVSADSLTNQK